MFLIDYRIQSHRPCSLTSTKQHPSRKLNSHLKNSIQALPYERKRQQLHCPVGIWAIINLFLQQMDRSTRRTSRKQFFTSTTRSQWLLYCLEYLSNVSKLAYLDVLKMTRKVRSFTAYGLYISTKPILIWC